MKKILNYMEKRLKSDRGNSTTIEFMVYIIIFATFSITIMDISFLNNNQSMVLNSVQNGSRLAAVYGGVGEGSSGTPIAEAYGAKIDPSCKISANAVECAVETELRNQPLTNVHVKEIKCGPSKTNKIGARTYCSVTYVDKGIPGSAASYMKRSTTKTVQASAESEVIVK